MAYYYFLAIAFSAFVGSAAGTAFTIWLMLKVER